MRHSHFDVQVNFQEIVNESKEDFWVKLRVEQKLILAREHNAQFIMLISIQPCFH